MGLVKYGLSHQVVNYSLNQDKISPMQLRKSNIRPGRVLPLNNNGGMVLD